VLCVVCWLPAKPASCVICSLSETDSEMACILGAPQFSQNFAFSASSIPQLSQNAIIHIPFMILML
jgi:hypothetical protein